MTSAKSSILPLASPALLFYQDKSIDTPTTNDIINYFNIIPKLLW